MRKILIIIYLIIFVAIPVSAANFPGVSAEMNKADYWIKNSNINMHNIVLNAEEIRLYNKHIEDIYKQSGKYALSEIPSVVSAEQVTRWMSDLDFYDDELYANGRLMSADLRKLLKQARNIESIPAKVQTRYGVVVRRSNMRTFPTKLAAFESSTDKMFDNFQETAVDSGMPVAILHESKNRMFYFVQIDKYHGWISKADVGVISEKSKWLEYVNIKNFLVVVDKKLVVNTTGEQILFQMGSKIKLKSAGVNGYVVIIPTADRVGKLREIEVSIPAKGVNKGYLAYTRANILKQAFGFIGEPYGWGGLRDSVDCSSFLQDVYNTVGLRIPRNADEQAKINRGRINTRGLSTQERLQLQAEMKPGAALFSPTHVVLYLGTVDGKPYGIHALSSYVNNKGVNVDALEVLVSPLQIKLPSGNILLNTFNAANNFQ